jgi:hypothetical protein
MWFTRRGDGLSQVTREGPSEDRMAKLRGGRVLKSGGERWEARSPHGDSGRTSDSGLYPGVWLSALSQLHRR